MCDVTIYPVLEPELLLVLPSERLWVHLPWKSAKQMPPLGCNVLDQSRAHLAENWSS